METLYNELEGKYFSIEDLEKQLQFYTNDYILLMLEFINDGLDIYELSDDDVTYLFKELEDFTENIKDHNYTVTTDIKEWYKDIADDEFQLWDNERLQEYFDYEKYEEDCRADEFIIDLSNFSIILY